MLTNVHLQDALNVVSRNLFLQVLFPQWLLRWGTSSMRRFHTAYTELGQYMQEMIDARRSAEVKEERHDLFSSLLDANEGLAESGEKLSDTGLLGNVFIFMVAGYEVSPTQPICRRPCQTPSDGSTD